MILEGVLPPAQTVGNGTLLDALDALEETVLDDDRPDERLDELDVVVTADVLESVDEAEVEDWLVTIDDPVLEGAEDVGIALEDELEVAELDEVKLEEADAKLLETVEDVAVEEVLERIVVVPVDAGSKSLNIASTPEFETAGLRRLLGQPPLMRFSREAPTHPARLEQSSASSSTDYRQGQQRCTMNYAKNE